MMAVIHEGGVILACMALGIAALFALTALSLWSRGRL